MTTQLIGVWRYIHHDGQYLHSIGRKPDGTLHNPNGYPEGLVLAAISAAEGRAQQQRSEAAQKAADTRRKRIDRKIYIAAQRIVDGHVYGPARKCQICGRGLGDRDSIERGIGSECWQTVLAHMTRRAAGEDSTEAKSYVL